MIYNPRLGLPMLQIMDTRIGFPCPFRNVVFDYFSPTPLIEFIIKIPILTSFQLYKHNGMTPLPLVTSSSRQRHDVIIYLARNDGAKILSQPETTFPQTCKFWVQICLQWGNNNSYQLSISDQGIPEHSCTYRIRSHGDTTNCSYILHTFLYTDIHMYP